MTLLDFWGTWCAPCLKTTPAVKNMYKTHRDKLSIISIAHDTDIEKVRNYINKEKLTWNQAFVLKKGSTSDIEIILEMNIMSFPTFILLDSKGKIVFRGGSQSVSKIDKFLTTN